MNVQMIVTKTKVQFANRKALKLFANLVSALREDGRNSDADTFVEDVHRHFDNLITGEDTGREFKVTEVDLFGIANKYRA